MTAGPEAPKPLSTSTAIVMAVGLAAGVAAGHAADSLTRPPAGGFNVVRVAAAGVGGCVGGGLASLATRPFRRPRR